MNGNRVLVLCLGVVVLVTTLAFVVDHGVSRAKASPAGLGDAAPQHGYVAGGAATEASAGDCGFWCKLRRGWRWVKLRFQRIKDWLCRHHFIDCGDSGSGGR